MAVVMGCGGTATPEVVTRADENMPVVVADTVTVAAPVILPAQLYVEHDAYVYARSSGIVERVFVDIGDRVRTGDTLARLEDVDQQIALADAAANFANAERLVVRFRELAGSGAVSVADSELAELEHRRWQLQVRQARRDVELTRAIAPFTGVVTGRTVRLGRLVNELDSLFRVTALRPLRASVHLPEQVRGIARGDSVVVVALDGTEHPATVERLSPTIDPSAGTREVIIRLTRGAEAALEPGISVRVRLLGAPRTVVAIPRDAVAEDGFVLVREGDRTTYRRVTLGAELDDGRIEVLSGLAPGETVVRAGQ